MECLYFFLIKLIYKFREKFCEILKSKFLDKIVVHSLGYKSLF